MYLARQERPRSRDLPEQAGIGRDRMYFNIARVGNTSTSGRTVAATIDLPSGLRAARQALNSGQRAYASRRRVDGPDHVRPVHERQLAAVGQPDLVG